MDLIKYFTLATSPSIVRWAIKYSIVVGTILISINHGDSLLKGDIDKLKVIKIILTYSVPYIVFTFSSVQATIFNESKQNRTIYQSSNLEVQKIQVPEIEETKLT